MPRPFFPVEPRGAERHRDHLAADPEQRADVDLLAGAAVDEDRDAAAVGTDADLQAGDAVVAARHVELLRLRPVAAVGRGADHQVAVFVVLVALFDPAGDQLTVGGLGELIFGAFEQRREHGGLGAGGLAVDQLDHDRALEEPRAGGR